MSELIEAVWGGAEPSTARNQIQADISALRRRLRGREPAGGPAGYTVSLRPGELDVDVFADRVRKALAATGPAETERLLREALARQAHRLATSHGFAFLTTCAERLTRAS